MSLGSKELFHSNFLEFLWEVDHGLFCDVINGLKGCKLNLVLDPDVKYEVGRESRNFDLCVFHRKNKKIIYDLIIENKVKSIPNKKQLDTYVGKVANTRSTKFLLLSLMTEFADRQEIEKEELWHITDYESLKDSIKNALQNNHEIDVKYRNYIEDYCKFIDLMVELNKSIVPVDFLKNELFPKDLEEFKKCRLHDLYIKLRCGKFIELLTEKLVNGSLGRKFTVEYTDEVGDKLRNKILKNNLTADVYVNIGINKGEGQIAAFVFDKAITK
jgi:hypothetical protein